MAGIRPIGISDEDMLSQLMSDGYQRRTQGMQIDPNQGAIHNVEPVQGDNASGLSTIMGIAQGIKANEQAQERAGVDLSGILNQTGADAAQAQSLIDADRSSPSRIIESPESIPPGSLPAAPTVHDVAGVVRPDGTLLQQRGQVEADSVESHNQLAELARDTGEIQSDTARKQSQHLASSYKRAIEKVNASELSTDERLAEARRVSDQMYEDIKKAREGVPDNRTIGQKIGSGLITALAGLTTKNGFGLGSALGLINNAINKDQQESIEQHDRLVQSLPLMHSLHTAYLNEGIQGQQAATTFLAQLKAADAFQLESWAKEQEDGVAKNLAQKAAIEQENQARSLLHGQIERDIKTQATGAKNSEQRRWWSVDLPTLIATPDHVLGKAGQDVRNQKLQMDQGGRGREAGIAAQKAQAEKNAREADAKTNPIPGYNTSTPLNDAAVNKVMEMVSGTNKVVQLANDLQALRQKNEGASWSKEDQRQATKLRMELAAAESVASGQGNMTDADAERRMGLYPDPTDIEIRQDSNEFYERLKNGAHGSLNKRLEAYGVSPTQPPQGQNGPAPNAANRALQGKQMPRSWIR